MTTGIVLQGVQLESAAPKNGKRLFEPAPINTPLIDKSGHITNPWQKWFSAISELYVNMLSALPVVPDSSGNVTITGSIIEIYPWRFKVGVDADGNTNCLMTHYWNGSTWVQKESQTP